MTPEQLKEHYYKNMCEKIAEICKKQLGELPENLRRTKLGIFSRQRVERERYLLGRALCGCFEVSVDGIEQMGYDEICDAIWNKLEERIPYWVWIVRQCNEAETLDLDVTEAMPWEGILDVLDLMDFAMVLEERYDVELCDRISDEASLGGISAKELVTLLAPMIDELHLLDE